MKKKLLFFQKGFGLIEIVVSVAIIGAVLYGFFLFYRQSLVMSQKTTVLVQSNMLLVEGIEVVKFLRDESWSTNIVSLATSTSHYLIFTSGDWEIVSTSTTIDNVFTRWFVLEDVFRDGSDDIAASGTFDPNTKKLTMNVAAAIRDATTTESVETYIANLFDN
jgi:prepilin-type N-terminal cleavage/methylation domain-containing protein